MRIRYAVRRQMSWLSFPTTWTLFHLRLQADDSRAPRSSAIAAQTYSSQILPRSIGAAFATGANVARVCA